jgi:hypothetical protein
MPMRFEIGRFWELATHDHAILDSSDTWLILFTDRWGGCSFACLPATNVMVSTPRTPASKDKEEPGELNPWVHGIMAKRSPILRQLQARLCCHLQPYADTTAHPSASLGHIGGGFERFDLAAIVRRGT